MTSSNRLSTSHFNDVRREENTSQDTVTRDVTATKTLLEKAKLRNEGFYNTFGFYQTNVVALKLHYNIVAYFKSVREVGRDVTLSHFDIVSH